MSLLVALFVIVASLPAFYAALRTDLITVPNKKYNTYFLRLFVIYPVLTGGCIFISSVVYLFFEHFLGDAPIFEEYEFLKYSIILIPLVASVFIVFILKKIIFKNQIVQNLSIMENQLFIYFPKKKIMSRKLHGTKYRYPKRTPGELLIGYQVTNLILDTDEINEKIAYTDGGELIVNEQTLSLLKEQNLTGFSTRAVQYKGKMPQEDKRHHQILTTNTMPPLSPLTKIKKNNILYMTVIAANNELFYEQKALQNRTDFNHSLEYFGSDDHNPGAPYRYWIVSPKVKELFIQQLGQKEQDFTSVIIIKDEEPQSNFQTDE